MVHFAKAKIAHRVQFRSIQNVCDEVNQNENVVPGTDILFHLNLMMFHHVEVG